MSNVHYLRNRTGHPPGLLGAKRKVHAIDLRVIDPNTTRRTRWYAQFAIQEAASYKALKGFKDLAVRHWLSFDVSPSLLPEFLRNIKELVSDGLIDVRIDGRKASVPGVRRVV